ncbi:MAG: hypothetical protein J2P54_11765, partial [Bradyrhizobiaceae bacterium]|nr:hypothetical protein [Bradyrhizobiaceae bacterium]
MMTNVCRGVTALLMAAAAIGLAPRETATAAEGETFGPGEAVTLTDAQRAKILRAITTGHGASGSAARVINEPSKPASST